MSLVRTNCFIFQAACFDLSVTSLQFCALSLLTDVPVNLREGEELQSEFFVQRQRRREQRAAL